MVFHLLLSSTTFVGVVIFGFDLEYAILGFHGMFDLGGLRLGFTYGNSVPDRVWDRWLAIPAAVSSRTPNLLVR